MVVPANANAPKKAKKPRKANKASGLPRAVERPRVPVAQLFRMFVIGAISVAAATYGIYRYYFVPRVPMVAPAASPTEIPAPELEPPP